MSQVPALIPSDDEMKAVQTIARTAHISGMYNSIGSEAKCFAIGLTARELGVPPMIALAGGIRVIQGNVEVSPKIMSMLIRKHGHSIKVKKYSNTECIIYAKRKDTGDDMEVSYTMQDAQTAGLVKQGSGWTKHPADMLYNRAMGRIGRMLFADILGGSYAFGEIEIEEAHNNEQRETKVQDISKLDEATVEVMPAELPPEENEQKTLAEFIRVIPDPDKEVAVKYLEAVCLSQKMTLTQAINVFSENEKTMERFKNNLKTFKEQKKAA